MDIVRDIVDHYRAEGYAEPEEEQEELRRLAGEAGEWVKLGGFLLEELADKRERKESNEVWPFAFLSPVALSPLFLCVLATVTVSPCVSPR